MSKFIDRERLRQLISDAFNDEELRTLCFSLGIKYDDLPASGTVNKVRELVALCERDNRLPELVTQCQQMRPGHDWPAADDGQAVSPYKGLLYFDVTDAPLFFGREALTEELLAHLRQHRFLAVVGASGSGKSSVVRAGVIPALQKGGVEMNGRSSQQWPIHIITPGDEPLKALAVTLTRDVESVTATATLLKDLQASSDSLDLFLYRQLAEQPESRLVLVIDQFEELFTQCDDAEARRLLVENLVTAVKSGKQGRLTLILTLRADFYAYAVPYEGLRPLLETRQKIVGAMNPTELRRAIEAPAEREGWQFEPGLVDRLLADVGAEPGALPLLSHALLETWRRRLGRRLTHEGYVASGQVQGAIATTAQRTFEGLSQTQQAIARHIFLQLTELGEGTEDTRRRVEREQLTSQTERMAQVEEVLTILADARLVTTDEASAEVAHEALIRNWPALRRWLDENREGLRLQRRLATAAQEWEENEREESYLYRGGQLTQVQEWLTSEKPDLHPLESAFVTASIAQQEQAAAVQEAQRQRELETAQRLAEEAEAREQAEQKRSRLARQVLLVVAVFLILAVGAAAYGFIQRNEAMHQSRISLAQSIAALAPTLLQPQSNDTELTTLLALEASYLNVEEAGDVTWLIDASLRSVLNAPYFNNIFSGYESSVRAVAFSPNGHWLVSGNDDATMWLWDMGNTQAEPIILRGHESRILSLAFSLDGRWLASGSEQTLLIWDMDNIQTEPMIVSSEEDFVWSIAFSPDNKWLASETFRTVRLWNMDNLKAGPINLKGHEDWVRSVAFSPDGRWLASGSDDTTVRLWSMDNLQAEPIIFNDHESSVWSIAFSPDGRWLASGSLQTILMWKVNNPQAEPMILSGHELWVRAMAFSLDGRWLASGGDDTTVRLWDMDNPQAESTVLNGHKNLVLSVAFSPDGRWLASGSDDTTLRLWDVGNSQMGSMVFDKHVARVWSVAFSPDGRWLASGSDDTTIQLWDVYDPQGDPLILRDQSSSVFVVTFSPDSHWLAFGSDDTNIRLLNMDDFQVRSTILSGHTSSIRSVAFSPDGRWLASGSDDPSVLMWDMNDIETEPMVLRGHEASILSVTFSPDGRWLASGSEDTTIRLWDMNDLVMEPKILFGHGARVRSVAFSPDGRWLASGSADRTVRLWDMGNHEAEPTILSGYEAGSLSVAFSPDGRWLVSGNSDKTVRLWDMDNLQAEPMILSGHEDWVWSVAFSPDKHWIASGSADKTVRLWLTHEALVEIGCQKVRRNLTQAEWSRYLGAEPYHVTCPNLPPGE